MQDNLLIAHTDLKDIAGQFSDNIEARQVDPYILEAQTGEIRRFLGDELYLELLTGFTVGEVAGFSGKQVSMVCAKETFFSRQS